MPTTLVAATSSASAAGGGGGGAPMAITSTMSATSYTSTVVEQHERPPATNPDYISERYNDDNDDSTENIPIVHVTSIPP